MQNLYFKMCTLIQPFRELSTSWKPLKDHGGNTLKGNMKKLKGVIRARSPFDFLANSFKALLSGIYERGI